MKQLSFFLFFVLLISCSPEPAPTYPIGEIKTNKGDILFWLHEGTPKHKENFIKLATENYWDSLTFNRIIEGFVAQGGCPDVPEGFADCPYLLDGEFNDSIKHIYGAVGAGRDNNPEKRSAGCQFYIVQNKAGIPRLDGDYTIFGQVFKGMEIVDAIVSVEKDSLEAPISPIQLDVNVLYLTKEQLTTLGYRF
jgi:peptidyl-prolyl cis-trans isomerase B (cyclophilin B)